MKEISRKTLKKTYLYILYHRKQNVFHKLKNQHHHFTISLSITYQHVNTSIKLPEFLFSIPDKTRFLPLCNLDLVTLHHGICTRHINSLTYFSLDWRARYFLFSAQYIFWIKTLFTLLICTHIEHVIRIKPNWSFCEEFQDWSLRPFTLTKCKARMSCVFACPCRNSSF